MTTPGEQQEATEDESHHRSVRHGCILRLATDHPLLLDDDRGLLLHLGNPAGYFVVHYVRFVSFPANGFAEVISGRTQVFLARADTAKDALGRCRCRSPFARSRRTALRLTETDRRLPSAFSQPSVTNLTPPPLTLNGGVGSLGCAALERVEV